MGWTEYRVVLDFTSDTYTLSSAHHRRRPLDAAQGRRRPHLRHPHARGHRPHHHGQPALPRATRTPTCGSTTCSSPTAASSRPDTTAPAAPAALLAVDTPADTGGSIDLCWAAATDNVGVTGYKLYRGTAAGVYGAPTTLGNVTDLHRHHRRHRHALLLRGVRRRRRRQRGREVTRGPPPSRSTTPSSRPPASTAPSSPAPTGRALTPGLDALGHPPARRVRHHPRQERHPLSGWIHGPTHGRRRRRLGSRRHDL